ncbi:MAG: DUF4115 domain-containing protein [Candidatus Rokubacteria bacterium]|nr:DUF4115 domain-containing protein [Candidatus Rokubacteria bacterium]
MSSLGSHLRELRERRAVSLDEISRVTRVPRSYLEALETGELSKLPAPVFVRGFIRAYCQVLGAPPAEALSHYDNRAAETEGAVSDTVAGRPRGRGDHHGAVVVSFVLLVVLGVALFAVTLALQSGRGDNGRPAPSTLAGPAPRNGPPGDAPATPTTPVGVTLATPAPEHGATPTTETPPVAAMPQAPPAGSAPPRAALLEGSPAATTRSAPSAPTPAVSATAPSLSAPTTAATSPGDVATRLAERPAATSPDPDRATSRAKDAERLVASVTSPYRLIARTSEPTWIRVRTEDGRQLSEETIPAGQVREWVSNRRFEVIVGNAGGVRLELNGQTLPPLGPSREVVRLALPPQAP